MDYSMGFTTGNQYQVGDGENRIGFFGSLSYKNKTSFYQGAENNFYRKNADTSLYELETDRTQKGDLGKQNILFSGLLGTSFRTERSKYKLNMLHIQNGESSAGYFHQSLNFSDFVNFSKDNLEYTQRAISNVQLSGTHNSTDASWTTEWTLSPTLSKIQDKDIRTTSFRVEDGVYSIPQNNQPKRIWRDLEEVNAVAQLDLTKKYLFFNRDAKLKFGAYGAYKDRDFGILNFEVENNTQTTKFNGIADNILRDENLWTVNNNSGSYIDPDISISEPANTYQAKQQHIAGYISNEFKIGQKIRTVLGIRAEQFVSRYTGEDNKDINDPQKVIYNNERIIDKLDIFPTANVIYELNENINLRGSYSLTTARPSFKEASIAKIYDPLSNNTFIGNIDLAPTYINNFDFRIEWFGESAEMIALSSFYKTFTDPIELTYFESSSDNFTPKNLGDAEVVGLEFEIRKNLGFIATSLSNFSFNLNTSLIKSTQIFGESERNLRELGLREGEQLGNDRELQGQSPYMVNTGLHYKGVQNGVHLGLNHNVQGKTLQVVGNGFVPDVYTMPFNHLTFNFAKSFGANKGQSISFKVENLLDDALISEYESYGAQNRTFSKRNLGRTFSLGYSITF